MSGLRRIAWLFVQNALPNGTVLNIILCNIDNMNTFFDKFKGFLR